MNVRGNWERIRYISESKRIVADGGANDIFFALTIPDLGSSPTVYLRVYSWRIRNDASGAVSDPVCHFHRGTTIAGGTALTARPFDPRHPAAQATPRSRVAADDGVRTAITVGTIGRQIGTLNGPRTPTNVSTIGARNYVELLKVPVLVFPLAAGSGNTGLYMEAHWPDNATGSWLYQVEWEECWL